MKWTYDDGGRADAGYNGSANDCVCRAVAIASGLPYQTVYGGINKMAKRERPRNGRKRSSAWNGVSKRTTRKYIESIGGVWVPTMGIGTGCTHTLTDGVLPLGRLVVSVSKHVVAVIDGVIRDTYDPSRDGTRCVYGYFRFPTPEPEPIPSITVAELKRQLDAHPDDALVMLSRDASVESNDFMFGIMGNSRYNPENDNVGIDVLTDELRESGYGPDDTETGQRVIVLFPNN